jgi:pimeloyl-ACP methyl ester carboxylesterase
VGQLHVAAGSSPRGYACVDTWLTDFRDDVPKIDVPTLVIHGTDRIRRSRPPPDGCAVIADAAVVPVEAGRTPSPGRTPRRSTQRCSVSRIHSCPGVRRDLEAPAASHPMPQEK